MSDFDEYEDGDLSVDLAGSGEVVVDGRTKGFVQVPKWLIRCDLTPVVLHIYCAVLSLGSWKQQCYRHGPALLAEYIGIHPDRVRAGLRNLVRLGLLRRQDGRPGSVPIYYWFDPEDEPEGYTPRRVGVAWNTGRKSSTKDLRAPEGQADPPQALRLGCAVPLPAPQRMRRRRRDSSAPPP